MNFDLRSFVKKGLIAAIGVQADYWVILTSANWYAKGILTTDDLAEIQELIDKKNTPVEPIEETQEATQEDGNYQVQIDIKKHNENYGIYNFSYKPGFNFYEDCNLQERSSVVR